MSVANVTADSAFDGSTVIGVAALRASKRVQSPGLTKESIRLDRAPGAILPPTMPMTRPIGSNSAPPMDSADGEGVVRGRSPNNAC
jgi:hypothetical protein